MAYEDQYKAKLTDSHGAVAQIGSNSIVAIGQAVCQPPALMEALAVRAEAGSVDNVKVYYMHAEENMKKSLLRYELMGRIKPYCMFMQEAERDLIKRAEEDGGRKVVHYVPNSFSQSIRFFAEHIHVDTFLVTVSPMDRNGYFTFGTNNDYTSSAARQAKRLIVEVNRHMPRVFGRSSLHISEVDAIVENDAPLLTLTPRPIQDQERKLGQRIAELIPEYACLQIGVGGVPSGVCEALMDRKDLGIHTEVLNPALAQLIQSGVVTNRWKRINPGKSVFTFAMGDEAFYEFLHDNIAIESHPVNYVNDPAVIAQNDNVVSVNSTIEMDPVSYTHLDVYKRQVITLAGVLEFTTLGGETFTIHPGDVLVAMDHMGSGHKWRLVNEEPWKRAYVVFKEGADVQFIPDSSAVAGE